MARVVGAVGWEWAFVTLALVALATAVFGAVFARDLGTLTPAARHRP